MFQYLSQSFRSLFITGLAVYALAAFCSEGYHHPDEHFQILEFAGFKTGKSPAADLPWEFQEKIRPALQPAMAFGIIKSLNVIGLENPFTLALLMRLLGAVLTLLLYRRLSRMSAPEFSNEQSAKLLLLSAIFLWFMPYLAVRFSSENWAALSFLAAVAVIPGSGSRQGAGPTATAGFLLGLCFFFRFQMAFAIAGVSAWLLFRQRVPAAHFAFFVLGGLGGAALGFAADYWFYGELVCTPWNYFQSNIIQGKASEFGVSPWWFYVPEFVVRAIPPISVVLLGLAAIGLYRKPGHVFTWALVPFILAHIVVGHKEMRFLFPMVFPVLFLAAVGWESLAARWQNSKITKVILRLCLFVNAIALIFVCTQPAQERLPYFRFLYRYTKEKPSRLYVEKENPYRLVGIRSHFYEAPNLNVQVVDHFEMLHDSVLHKGDLLLHRQPALPPGPLSRRVERIYTYFPDWALQYNVNNWQDRSRIWSIYQVK